MTNAKNDADISAILEEERDFHNRVYAGSKPFDFPSLYFTKEDVWRRHDHSYKKGTHLKGRRIRLMFEMLDLERAQGKRFLDVGCGNGQFSIFFAMYGAEVWGIDISDVGIQVAERFAQTNGVADRCHFLTADATQTTFPDDFFDVIVFNAVLHHAVKYPGLDAEVWRILKPGGRVVFGDILRDNKIYNTFKSIYLLMRPETDSGVNISFADYQTFMRPYEDVVFQRLSLFEGIKVFVPRSLVGTTLSRAMLYLADRLDALLLRLFPGLSRYCLDIVGSMRKPVRVS